MTVKILYKNRCGWVNLPPKFIISRLRLGAKLKVESPYAQSHQSIISILICIIISNFLDAEFL
jgi:hypothetical protein